MRKSSLVKKKKHSKFHSVLILSYHFEWLPTQRL